MRRTFLVVTVVLMAPTAAMALTAGGELLGGSELGAAWAGIQKRQIAPGGVAASGQRGLLGGNVILAKGDQSATGAGLGGQKGQKKGGHKGKQADGKDNPDKQKGKEKGKS